MSHPAFFKIGRTQPVFSCSGNVDCVNERLAKWAIDGAKNCAHSFSSTVGIKSNLDDLFFSFTITLYTAVIVTGSKTVKVGIHFVSGTNEEFAGFRPSLVNDAAISRLIEINLSLKKV